MQVTAKEFLRWHLSFIDPTPSQLDELVEAYENKEVAHIELLLGRFGDHTVTVDFLDSKNRPSVVVNFQREGDAILAYELLRQGPNGLRCELSVASQTVRVFSLAERKELHYAIQGVLQRAQFPYDTVELHLPQPNYLCTESFLQVLLAGVYSDTMGNEHAVFFLFDLQDNYPKVKRVVGQLQEGYSHRDETALRSTGIVDSRSATSEIRRNTGQPKRSRY